MRRSTVLLLWGALMLSWASTRATADDQRVGAVDRPDASADNTQYVGNRAPLAPSPLRKLPIGAIRPEGWLRRQLELQAAGFHGHLGEISRFVKKENNAWLSPTGEGEAFWEELPYWLKGFGDCGYVLGDERIIREAREWIEGAIRSQREDGWFGPRAALTSLDGKPDLWGNMIMLFCLQSYHEYTGDARVIELMKRYFRWQLAVAEDDFLVGYWPKMRGADNLWSVYWLYNRTGDDWLLELAAKIYRRTAPWGDDIINWHNVNFAQAFDTPAIYWMQSKQPGHLEAAYRNYDKMRAMYGRVPGGMYGSDENCRPGYSGPRQAVETCGMVEMMLSCEQLVMATGDLLWADRCEDVAFNSLPAAILPDHMGLRYLTAPNQPLSDRSDKSPGVQNGGPMFLFDPRDHRCCQHNYGHGWPYFAESLWMAAPGNGLAAVFYAASTVRAKVGDGAEVTIAEKTRYPFSDSIELGIAAPRAVRFPLYLRVPGWCDAPRVEINGRPLDVRAKPRQFLVIERAWSDGDRVVLRLPMRVEVVRWKENSNSASVARGPLTYSLRIGQRAVKLRENDPWPAWELHPTTPWNYALVLDPADPAAGIEAIERPWPADDQPFTLDGAPVELRAKGRRVPEWQLDERGLVEELQESPVRTEEPIETITLVPMGAARLRIAAFPVAGDGPDARRWTSPARRPKAAASHCWHGDALGAMSDGRLPKSSADQSIPRFTWWDHRGTTEWVEYRFDAPRELSAVEVYWFDDTGAGQCRVPKSWRVERLDGETWKPLETRGAPGVEPDRFNRVEFAPVVAGGVRLVVELQPGFSAGILEWRVEP